MANSLCLKTHSQLNPNKFLARRGRPYTPRTLADSNFSQLPIGPHHTPHRNTILLHSITLWTGPRHVYSTTPRASYILVQCVPRAYSGNGFLFPTSCVTHSKRKRIQQRLAEPYRLSGRGAKRGRESENVLGALTPELIERPC